jgi:hypothetical protein
LTRRPGNAQTSTVVRARRHQTVLARLALLLLALIAELVGRSLTHRIDLGRHVATPSYARTDYYPMLLVFVKGGVALMLALVTWRFLRARAVAAAAGRLLAAHGRRTPERPRMRFELSPRLWFGAFAVTSCFFLVQTDAERMSVGRWPLLAPWLHTSALPVFAVLAVVVAFVYGLASQLLAAYETYARETAVEASLVGGACAPAVAPTHEHDELDPRALFGLAFESRPPPVPA